MHKDCFIRANHQRRAMSQIAAITVKVVTEAPVLGQGDTDARPKPDPRARMISDNAAAANAPPMHTHEVFFRDTAHGFLAWAVAVVIGAAVLASGVSSLLSGGAHAAGTVASGAADGASRGAVQENPFAYYVDSLFRSDHPNANATDQDVRAEAARILAAGIRNGDVPAGDKTYLAQLVAARTGISQADAEKRVDDVIAQAKAAETKARQIADATRKAGAYLSIFTAVSMLIGAFIAAAAAALGGRHRDEDWRAVAGPLGYR